jgi:SMC interacting uncharacterized protein involved in chromosome segregation
VTGCGVSESEYEKVKGEKEEARKELDKYKSELEKMIADLKTTQNNARLLENQNKSLIKELEEYKHGAERIIAIVENSYREKKYKIAKQNIELLKSTHPESNKISEFNNLLQII